MELVNKYGADAIRYGVWWNLMRAPAALLVLCADDPPVWCIVCTVGHPFLKYSQWYGAGIIPPFFVSWIWAIIWTNKNVSWIFTVETVSWGIIRYWVSVLTADGLVLKHQVISHHNTDLMPRVPESWKMLSAMKSIRKKEKKKIGLTKKNLMQYYYDHYYYLSPRLYLINSPVVRAENLRFTEEGVRDVVKDVFLPWFNAYRFLLQNVSRFERVSDLSFACKTSFFFHLESILCYSSQIYVMKIKYLYYSHFGHFW